MKRDPYNNERRWESWKENHYNKPPKGIRRDDWKLLIQFLKDMELGLNTPIGRKGKRDIGTLLNLSSHNKLFLENFKKPLVKLNKKDLHNFEKDIDNGKILKRNGEKYTAFGNYIKDFKVFWGWMIRTKKVKENIAEDITSKTDKPSWVYLSDEQIKEFFNQLSLDYRTICWFMYDTGMRVTEAVNVKVEDFSDDFKQVTIREETAKTFGRTINLKLSVELVKEYIKSNNLQPEDYFIEKAPFTINKYLRYHSSKLFGADNISHPKAKGKYKEFTLYDIRHNSSIFWLNRYPTHKGLMYRFGWRQTDKIEYYSGFLGIKDEITDTDMVLSEDRDKIYKLENELQQTKNRMEEIENLVSGKYDSFESAIDIETGKDLKKATPQELLERDKMINDRMVKGVGEWDSRMKVKVK